jgi:hypothetical protein
VLRSSESRRRVFLVSSSVLNLSLLLSLSLSLSLSLPRSLSVLVLPAGSIGYYEVCVSRVGNSTLGDAYPCTYVGLSDIVTLQPNVSFRGNLTAGQWFVFTVKAYNRAGLYSSRSSAPVQWNVLDPRAGRVFDGPVLYSDIDYQSNTTLLWASWAGQSLTTTDIGWYEVGVGQAVHLNATTNAADPAHGNATLNPVSVRDWVNVGLNTSITLQDLSLTPFATYFITVKIVKRSNLPLSYVYSNGVRIVTRPAYPGSVRDGSTVLPLDLDYQRDLQSFAANWDGFYNEGVPLRYSVELLRLFDLISLPTAPVSPPVLDFWLPVGTSNWIRTDLGDRALRGPYRVRVCAMNPVDMSTCVESDGVVLDDQPPTAGMVFNGFTPAQHLQTQESTEIVQANWVSGKASRKCKSDRQNKQKWTCTA